MVVKCLVEYMRTSMARISSSSGTAGAAPSFDVIDTAKRCDSQYVRSGLRCGGALNRAGDFVGGVE